MRIVLHIWRQPNASAKGRMVRYEVPNVNEHMSFLEMLDVLNESLIARNEDPVAFDSDCREGICGMCGCMVNGVAHGPLPGTTLCQLHMRHFKDGDELYLEPWRARAFPVIKDLVVDRRAFDRLIAAGRLHLGFDRQRARREHAVNFEEGFRPRHGCRGVHRLRRMRSDVSQRLGVALHGREGGAPRVAAAGPTRTRIRA